MLATNRRPGEAACCSSSLAPQHGSHRPQRFPRFPGGCRSQLPVAALVGLRHVRHCGAVALMLTSLKRRPACCANPQGLVS
jgi:hypothetical protein